MKAKQVEKLLTKVMENFLSSIKDENIKTIIKEKSFISGGCIPCMLMSEWVNDYDFYFYESADAEKVRNYFEDQHTKNKSEKFHVKLITENAINLSDKIQLITKFTGNIVEVTNNFDWQHIKSFFCWTCEPYESSQHGKFQLHLTDDVYKLIVEKELIYTGSKYPLSSLMRLKKYIKKGWTISNSTIAHIAMDFAANIHYQEICRHNSGLKLDQFDNTLLFVDDIIHHMNGVDPIIIQSKLSEKTGQYLSIEEIVKRLKG